jgi:hypothetical protein
VLEEMAARDNADDSLSALALTLDQAEKCHVRGVQ